MSITPTSLEKDLHRYLASKEEPSCSSSCLIIVSSKTTKVDITSILINYQSSRSEKQWLTSTEADMAALTELGEKHVYDVSKTSDDQERRYHMDNKMAIVHNLVSDDPETTRTLLIMHVEMLQTKNAFCVIVLKLSPEMEEAKKNAGHIGGFRDYVQVSDDGLTIVQTVRA